MEEARTYYIHISGEKEREREREREREKTKMMKNERWTANEDKDRREV